MFTTQAARSARDQDPDAVRAELAHRPDASRAASTAAVRQAARMIRNVVVARLRPDAAREDAERGLTAMKALQIEGLFDMKVGLDAGLREGNWDLAITADFADAEAYQRYDADEEHNRIRREIFAVICAEIVRIQFEV